MKKLKQLLIVLLMCAVSSCSTESGEDESDLLTKEDVTYKGTVKGIVEAHCLSCHLDRPVNGATFSLTTLQSVQTAVTDRGLIERIESGSMPPVGDVLTTAEVRAFKDWEAGGFKED